MRPRLPPLNALKAFEAAARHESFTRAAEELCVTQGAVSHQVKALEAELAVKLFNRERQRLIITEAGRDYLTVIRDALDRIAAGTERLVQRQSAGVLTVSTSPDLFAVCSPKLLSSRRRLDKVSDILKFPLIHLDSRADWAKWLQGVGIDDADVTHGPVLNRASMVIAAAINGQGIALARTTLAAWDLINGRLVRHFPESLRLSKTYWIVCPKATASLPKIVTFRDWLLAEASRDVRQLKTPGSRRAWTETV